MLETPNALGLAQSEQDNLHQQWSTFQRVQQRLQQEGFQPLPLPQLACPGYLDIETITSHDSRVLTTEYAKYKAWRDFAAERLMYSSQILLETQNEMEAIEARTKKRLRESSNKKYTKDEIKEESRSDARYEQLKLQEQENLQMKLAYETQVSRFSNAMTLISRSITIRGQDMEQGKRGGNIGANPSMPDDFR